LNTHRWFTCLFGGLITLLFVVRIYAHTPVTVPNADLENGFTSGVANNWTSFWISNGVSGAPSFFDATAIKHRGSHAQGINLTTIATSTDPLLKCYTGIYQQMSAQPGKTYTLSAWHYLDVSSSLTNVVSASVGIDPTGGTNPNSTNVVWSYEAWNGASNSAPQNWKQHIVTARATGSTITIFLRNTAIPYRFSTVSPGCVYFDQVYLMEMDDPTGAGTLNNWGFESSFVSADPQMPDSYPLYWKPYGGNYGNVSDNGIHMSAQTSGSAAEGSQCLQLYHGYGQTSAVGWGVCQKVIVPPGSKWELYAQTRGTGGAQFRKVGIDPTGATDKPSSQTVWAPYDIWEDGVWHTLYVPPTSPITDSITVFTSVVTSFCDASRIACFDDIELLQVGDETIPPGPVTNLTVTATTPSTVSLSWNCAGDDENRGKATSQVIKYSTQPNTEANWASATRVPSPPLPELRGTPQSMTVSGLNHSTTYYFAIKTYDECNNESPISNVPSATTLTDTTPPTAVTNLGITMRLSDSVQLSWTAPSHTNWQGQTEAAAKYEIRYSTSNINSSNWSSATVVVSQVPSKPAAPGTTQTTWVRGLAPNTRYYFAIKSADPAGNWSNISNCPNNKTAAQGTAPYWAYRLKENLVSWYNTAIADCQAADADVTDPDPFSWYFDSLDKDCEAQPGLCALAMIVPDPWLISFLGRLSDHVWNLTYNNTNIDPAIYRSTGQKVPTWNESHHIGELAWNGVGLIAVDWNNPKWLQRAVTYCRHYDTWCGYTGDASNGGPHLHFKSMWFKGDEWDRSSERGPQTLVDTPEDRRLTRPAFYAIWRDPLSQMSNGRLIKDWLYDLDTATAEDAMKTDYGKPVGVLPAEIGFYSHQNNYFSQQWWRQAASLGGALGSKDEWWWDWRVGWTPMRDAYYELIDQYLCTGEEKFIIPVRESICYFNVTAAINDIPPAEMYEELFPWPDRNNPYGHFQYLVNYMYRRATGDPQFDNTWVSHASRVWSALPRPGEGRYGRMWRSNYDWYIYESTYPFKAPNSFMMAWLVTHDKEWLCRALDEIVNGDVWFGHWMEALYTGNITVSANRLPDQPISWNNTNKYTNWAALVLDWDYTQVKWLTYNFDTTARTIPIFLWSLKPGNYVLRHGPDTNLDDKMDYVAETIPFTYTSMRHQISTTLPSGRMEVWEIVPESKTIDQARALPDNTVVYLAGQTVTATFDGGFYVEDLSRLNGIRVASLARVNVGDKVNLSGTMTTISGERAIKCVNVPVVSSGNPVPEPWAMTNRALGGASKGLQTGVWDGDRPAGGPGNIGLLIRTTGIVKEHGVGYMVIDDGSNCYRGVGKTGVKVYTSSTFPIGSYVVVTGVSSCEIPTGESWPVRVVRATAGGVYQAN